MNKAGPKEGRLVFSVHHKAKDINMEAIQTTAEGATRVATKNVKAFGTAAANADLNHLSIQRRKPTPHDFRCLRSVQRSHDRAHMDRLLHAIHFWRYANQNGIRHNKVFQSQQLSTKHPTAPTSPTLNFFTEVIVFTTSSSKVDDAKRLGADDVVLSKDENQMARYAGKLHFVLDAVSAQHDINAYLNLLRVDGSLTLVGAPEHPLPVAPFSLIPMRRSFAGSMIGGIPETQEMLDFCGKHNIVSDIEMINIQQINDAYDRSLKGDVKYRFVIDMASLKK